MSTSSRTRSWAEARRKAKRSRASGLLKGRQNGRGCSSSRKRRLDYRGNGSRRRSSLISSLVHLLQSSGARWQTSSPLSGTSSAKVIFEQNPSVRGLELTRDHCSSVPASALLSRRATDVERSGVMGSRFFRPARLAIFLELATGDIDLAAGRVIECIEGRLHCTTVACSAVQRSALCMFPQLAQNTR